MVATIDHIGISVPDIQKGIDWYKSTFQIYQMSEIMEVSAADDEIASDVFGKKMKSFKIVHMCTSDGFGIELFQFTEPKNESLKNNFEYWKTSIFHLAFTVTNIEEVCKTINSTGGKKRSNIWKLFKDKPYKICYCEDPWGNIIEISSHPYNVVWSNYTQPHKYC